MSLRVSGQSLKAAVFVHAQKQLASLGQPLRKGGFEVGFNGHTASAIWTQNNDGTAKDGKIMYPKLADNASLSRREADLFAAYTLHEIGHIAYTDNNASIGIGKSPEDALLFKLWNGIEDARMEHAVVKHGGARGARSMFKKLLNYLTTGVGETFNPTNIHNAPFALALLCRTALGNGNGFTRTLLARIPEPKRSLYAAAMEAMTGMSLARTGTHESLAAARKFLDDWKAKTGELQEQAQPPEQGDFPMPPQDWSADGEEQPEQGDEFADEGSDPLQAGGDKSDDGMSMPSDEQSDDSDEQSGGGVGDDSDEQSDDDGDSGFGDDSDDDGDEDGDGFGDDEDGDEDGEGKADAGMSNAEIDEASQGATEEIDLPQKGDDSMFHDAEGDSEDDADEQPGQGGGGDGFSDESVKSIDPNNVRSPEPSVNEIAKRINDRTKGALYLPDFVPAHRSDMSKWNFKDEPTERQEKNAIKKMIKSAPPAVRAQLARLLRAPERCGWDAGAFSGRFNIKRQTRMAAGSEAVFKQRWETAGLNTALSIVIDMSGSMRGEALKLAVECAYSVAAAAEAARVAVEVTGFSDAIANTRCVDGGKEFGGAWRSGSNWSHDTGGGGTLVVLKPYNRRTAACAMNFKRAIRMANGGTPDYSCVRTAAELISTRHEDRKIVMVLTDGYGYVEAMGEFTEAAPKLMGVEVVGIAIGMSNKNWEGKTWKTRFDDAYKIGAYCPDVLALPKTTLKELNKYLDRTTIGRRVM